MEMRLEQDSMGPVEVPADAKWRAQTQRACQNFSISGYKLPKTFIQALGYVKYCAAQANQDLDLLEDKIAIAIMNCAKHIIDGEHYEHFPVDVFQTGSGTSSNMNANEVIATLCQESFNLCVHPNDHVNMSQSSNDVIPTTIAIATVLSFETELKKQLEELCQTIVQKAQQLKDVPKTGRTHLMDAMPITFSQELLTWERQLRFCLDNLLTLSHNLTFLPQGGTAVGTGINAHKDFAKNFCRRLSQACGLKFHVAPHLFEMIAAQDRISLFSGGLKTLSITLMKIANDLRWMNSGPLAGFGEITLPALQPGSSIMPGKVNPVIPESAAMVSAHVIGSDQIIALACQSGNFQLNVMLPLIGYHILENTRLLGNTCRNLAQRALADFEVNYNNIQHSLNKNPILVTALNREIGYEQGAQIAKQAYQEGRTIVDVACEKTSLSREELEALLDPLKLTQGGIT